MSPSKTDRYHTRIDSEIFELVVSFERERLSQPYSDEADDRYPLWATRTQALLAAAGRWTIVTGEDARPVIGEEFSPEERELAERRLSKWEGRDAEACLIIDRMLSPDYMRTSGLFLCNSAKEMWDKIRHIHVEAGRGLKAIRVYRRMHARKYEEGTSLADFAQGFLTDNRLLQAYGTGMDDKMLALMIIQALPWHDDATRVALYPLVDKIFDVDDKAEPAGTSLERPTNKLTRLLRDIDCLKKLHQSSEAGSSHGRRHRKGQ